jgi:hypothetical protein
MPRNTSTGEVLERMILPALSRGGYSWVRKKCIGERLGGGRHFVDIVAEKEGKKYLISLKWQQVQGTAEQKVPFEVICLAHAIKQGGYEKAYLVLGGRGWKLKNFYVSGGLDMYLKNVEKVEIVELEDFIARCNSGQL